MAFTRRSLFELEVRPTLEVVDEWLLLMASAVENSYLEKVIPDYLREPLQSCNTSVKVHCIKIYSLCLKAQDGYFQQAEWDSYRWSDYHFYNLNILLVEANARARRERNKDRWVVIPDVNTRDFIVMMKIANKNVNARKNPWGINSHIFDEPDIDESMELTPTFFETSMERPYRRPSNGNRLERILENSGEAYTCEIL